MAGGQRYFRKTNRPAVRKMGADPPRSFGRQAGEGGLDLPIEQSREQE